MRPWRPSSDSMPAMFGGGGSGLTERALVGLARRTRGVNQVLRPPTDGSPEFELAYVRTGSPDQETPRPPIVVIPGGPGLGSILPYRGFRARAARTGLDLIMVEHRGIGLSRHDAADRVLPASAMRITEVVDDLAAVLDQERIEQAYIVGSSYGSYLASSFGVAHPTRVAGMLLDSALQSAHDIPLERAVLRALFWDADTATAEAVRTLVDRGSDQRVLLDVVRAAYELGGDALLSPLLERRLRSTRDPVWKALEAYGTRGTSIAHVPGIYEFDLVGTIGFRELGYGGEPDGLPLDPALTYAPLADRFPEFAGEPFDLLEGVRAFEWPLTLLSGTRDLRTPPQIAARTATAAPDAAVVTIENGHSALDTHPAALLGVLRWLVEGRHEQPDRLTPRLDQLPRQGVTAYFPRLLAATLRWERTLRRQ